MTPYATAQQAYRDSAILTAPPERLVVMLYDGANRFLIQGATAMRAGDLSVMNDRLRRAEAIINEMRATPDMSAGKGGAQLQANYSLFPPPPLQARLEEDAPENQQGAELPRRVRDA